MRLSRFIIIMLIFATGVGYGFISHLYYQSPPIVPPLPLPENRYSYMGFYCSADGWATTLNDGYTRLYNQGKLKTIITSDEFIWHANGPIELKSITIKEFSLEDNGTLVAEMSGDFGTITMNSNNEIEKIKVWGNNKVLKYETKDKTKDGQ